MFQDLEAKGKN
jgi:hypothetical protein